MNREIKFRAWDSLQKTMWTDGFVIFPSTGECNFPESGWDINGPNEDKNNFILMQYTGLHDKNGKEIYENDIVFINRRDSLSSISQSVIFNPYMGFCVYRELKGFEDFEYTPLGYFGEESIEVIGNIYETTELLER